MRNPFRRRTHDRSLWQVGDIYPMPGNSFAYQSSFTSADRALRLSAVWACVRLLADTVSTLPVDVFREGSRDPLPTPALLRQPASGWATHEWLYAAMVSLLLKGNCYGLITARTGAALRPAQVELLDPGLVTVTVHLDGSVEYRYKGEVVDRSDLWHVRAFAFPGSPTGLSPIEYGRQTVGLGLASMRWGNQFFEEGATPMGVLSTDMSINREQAEDAKARLVDATRGTREPLVLGDGIKWQQLSVSPAEFQWIEQQKFSVADVCRLYGVPPEMIAGESGDSLTYANVEGRDLSLMKYTVNPWLVRLEAAIGALLPRGQFVKFNADAVLRPTTKARYDAYAVALTNGFLTVDEVRELEDRPPLPEGAGVATAPLRGVA